MSWESILKISKIRHFLLEVFKVPVNIPLNIPKALMQKIGTPSYDGVITESRFEILLQLTAAKKYQELIDRMVYWYEQERKRVKVAHSKKWEQKPEVREKRKIYHKEYDKKKRSRRD
tara:strand:- start:3738 stop:4088 length:351 start_codon:yes stop_codon:yes gene_type:complete